MDRDPMPASDYSILQKNYLYLIQNIEAEDLIPHLHQHTIISADDMEALQKVIEVKGNKAGMMKIIERLRWSGSTALSLFLTCLKEIRHTEALDQLQATDLPNIKATDLHVPNRNNKATNNLPNQATNLPNKVTDLHAPNIKVTDLPNKVTDLPNIKVTDLPNKFTDQPNKSTDVHKTKATELSKNRSADLAQNKSSNLHNIKAPDLHKNKPTDLLKHKPTDLFNKAPDLPNMKTIYLPNKATDLPNKATGIPNVKATNQPNKSMDLPKHKPTDLPNKSTNQSNIKTIDLPNKSTNLPKNKVTDLPKNKPNKPTDLPNKVIDLSKNRSTVLPKNRPTDLPNMKATDLHKNPTYLPNKPTDLPIKTTELLNMKTTDAPNKPTDIAMKTSGIPNIKTVPGNNQTKDLPNNKKSYWQKLEQIALVKSTPRKTSDKEIYKDDDRITLTIHDSRISISEYDEMSLTVEKDMTIKELEDLINQELRWKFVLGITITSITTCEQKCIYRSYNNNKLKLSHYGVKNGDIVMFLAQTLTD